MILKTRRICKEEQTGQESLPSKSYPEVITRYRLPLSQVRDWEDDVRLDSDYWKNKDEKIVIYLKDGSYSLVLIKLEEFDKMMEDFLKKEFINKLN